MRVFSGIQPTNQLHIGNYLGAIRQWIQLQNKNECIFCIVDWHAITAPYETSEMQKRIAQVATVYLAAGVDPKKSIVFVQSDVKEHTELAWLLNTITPLGELKRMTQFKDKAKKFLRGFRSHAKRTDAAHSGAEDIINRYGAGVNAGLLNYPVLMAADILLYQTNLVPVGQDQKQHVELTREIAKRFNAKFGNTFVLPEPLIPKMGAKIMSLKEPLKKMSKSDPADTFISLFDSPAAIKKKIKAATTDSGKEIKYDPKTKPGISNLLTIFSLFSEKPVKEIENAFKGKGYQEFKQKLAELLIKKLEPFRIKKKEIESDPQSLEKILQEGARRAHTIANQTMEKVRKKMGLKTTVCF